MLRRIEADRADATSIRASVYDGGLGRSLVAAGATLHDGAFALLDNQPGLQCTLALPGATRRFPT